MPPATFADWTTPRSFALPDLGPGLEGERRQALETALQTIAADPTVQALVLFGSRATGNARPDSDLDLLVVLPYAVEKHQLTLRHWQLD
jgi:predicted nucleotidyltransferase